VFRGRKTLLFWFGLSVLTLASAGLCLMLGLIFIYYPTHYHQMHWDYPTYFPSYFWQYYIWQILGAVGLAVAGFFMMKSGTKKKEEGKTQLSVSVQCHA
jgi:hypothetical protein